MVNLKDIIQRSLNGPVMGEQDFDLLLSRKLRALTSHYSIRFSPDEVICGEALADSVWQAGLDLLERVGLYNLSTNRAVLIARDEVASLGSRAPKEFTLGAGKDAVAVSARAHGSETAPVILPQPVRTLPYKGGEQGLSVDMWEAYKEEATPLGDLARRLLDAVEGVPFMAATPGEMLWAKAMAQWKVAIAESMGKPGLYIGGVPVTSVPAILSCFLPNGPLNRYTGRILIHIMPELKLSWDALTLVSSALQMGVLPMGGTTSCLGAYCRNAEETSVVLVAGALGALACTEGEGIIRLGCTDPEGNMSSRAVIQAFCAACRAFERNLAIPVLGQSRGKNGRGTALRLYELAATTVARTCAGMAWGDGYICHPGPDGEYRVDLDCQFVTDIARSTAGMQREEANELTGRLLALYEKQDTVQEGRPFSYYYDLKTLTPAEELVRVHQRAREQLTGLGVPLP